jgi:glutamate synthase (NADPH/NADH) small chain
MKVDAKRVGSFPFYKSNPEERVRNFSEVQLPYNEEDVKREADRCLLCGTPVCIDACPVLMDVRGMCEAVARGDFKKAYERTRETNALLGVTARCCPQLQGLCEDACVLRWAGQPIAIGLIQRYIADWEKKNANQQPDPPKVNTSKPGKNIAVIGAGPAGLAGAELLCRYGHHVTIYEELPTSGGTAWYGVPDYHLPKDVLLYEIGRIQGMGVKIKTNLKVGKDITLSQLREANDAVLIATGSKDPVKLDTPGIDLAGIHDGYRFLEDVYVHGIDDFLKKHKIRLKNQESNEDTFNYDLGKKVMVVGGGDTALDCARTALRLIGEGTVSILYRRTENDMPADPVMIEEAKEEGVQFRFLAQPKSYEGVNGKVVAVNADSMQLGEPDQSGRRKPQPIPGKEIRIECSAVLLAVGRGPNSFLQHMHKNGTLETGKRNSIKINKQYKTSIEGVFATGDVTAGETLVVKAMASGREAAQRIHGYVTNQEDRHVSFYERYYKQNIYQRMLKGGKTGPPPQ